MKIQRFKLLVLALFLIIGVTTIFSKCSSSTAEYKKTPADTTQTFVTIVVPLAWQKVGIQGNTAVTTLGWRLTKDTLLFDSTDVNTLTKKWKRDTTYAFEIHLTPKDTTGNKRDSITYAFLPPKYILNDYNKNPNKP
jgi:hypothetical protein